MPIHTSAISGSIAGAFTAIPTRKIAEASRAGSFTGNSSSVASNTQTPDYYNSLLYGPITIQSGVEFTITANSSVKIIDLVNANA